MVGNRTLQAMRETELLKEEGGARAQLDESSDAHKVMLVYAALSPSLPGDFDRSMAGRDFVRGGDEGSEGGEVAKLSRSSKLAKALKALTEDVGSLSSFLPAGGVPVRLLAPLSSPPRTRLPPGPKFLRPLLLREPNMLEGPKDMGWTVRAFLRRRRSSVPTLLEA